MRLLLDTHVVLWAVSDDPRVGPKTREMLDSPDHVRVVSAATIWEVEIKIAIGKLAVDEDLRIVLANSAVEPLQISSFHAQPLGDFRCTMTIRLIGCWSRRRVARVSL